MSELDPCPLDRNVRRRGKVRRVLSDVNEIETRDAESRSSACGTVRIVNGPLDRRGLNHGLMRYGAETASPASICGTQSSCSNLSPSRPARTPGETFERFVRPLQRRLPVNED